MGINENTNWADMAEPISVIIPALNEEERIAEAIASARSCGPCQIIVVDGGSADRTVVRAEGADLVLASEPGRSRQQNLGARHAAHETLLFLHADCRLVPGAFEKMQAALTRDRTFAACFRQEIEATHWMYRMLEWGNRERVRWLGYAYGDQGICLKKEVFDQLGGFPNCPLLDDFFFMKRVRRFGRVAVIDHPLQVSARRWRECGIVRQTLRNWSLIALAMAGVSPARLARYYPHVR